MAAAVWGLDTGLAVTTFRVTAATWAVLVAVLTGMAPWWIGASYALAFVLPLTALMRSSGLTRNPGGPGNLFKARPALQLLSILWLVGSAIVILLVGEALVA